MKELNIVFRLTPDNSGKIMNNNPDRKISNTSKAGKYVVFTLDDKTKIHLVSCSEIRSQKDYMKNMLVKSN